MHWPTTPIEHLSTFQPRHCPWRACREHRRVEPGYRFRKHGTYSTARRRGIPRFLCLACERTFSRQSFSTSYYLKRPDLLPRVAAGLVGGSAFRQIARTNECAPNTVARMSARLGRHAMLLHARALEQLRHRLAEPIVFDHFETFEFTQDWPFGVGTAVGATSWFIYGVDPAPHRRTGKMTEAQKRRLRSRPRRPLHGGYTGSTTRILDGLNHLRPPIDTIDICWDGHRSYRRAVERHPERRWIRTGTYVDPPRGPKGSKRSPDAVERDRAMFPVDQLHALLRHSLAHHRRETIAFARRINGAMERLALTTIWRNFVKKRSERRGESKTPAVKIKLTDERWRWKRVLSQRLFHDRVELTEPWSALYRREWTTALLRANARHELRHAF